jgi:hypothetical protein
MPDNIETELSSKKTKVDSTGETSTSSVEKSSSKEIPKEKKEDLTKNIPKENSTAPVSAGEDNTSKVKNDRATDEIPEEEEKETSIEALPDVVRRFELRKIYSKLHSIENFLYNNNSFDFEIIKLQKDVSKAIELFNYMIDNLTAYKDNIDNLIKIFNDFIRKVFETLKKISKVNKKEEK